MVYQGKVNNVGWNVDIHNSTFNRQKDPNCLKHKKHKVWLVVHVTYYTQTCKIHNYITCSFCSSFALDFLSK